MKLSSTRKYSDEKPEHRKVRRLEDLPSPFTMKS